MFGIVRRVRDWFSVSDEQHVERVRRSVAKFDRHRRFLAGLHGFLVVVWLAVGVAMTILMERISAFFGAGNHWAPAGFLVGMMVGFPYAFAFMHNLHGLLSALVGLRNERLMIRYHDALENARPIGQVPSECE